MPGLRGDASQRVRACVALSAVLVLAGAAALAGPLSAASDPQVPPVSARTSPPTCRVADVGAKFPRTADWSRTLLDWRWKVSRSYVPPHLVPVRRAGLSGGGSVRADLVPDLKALATAARHAGAPLAVESAYRSYATQVSTFGYWVSRFGYRTALVGSARPGHSEHQLGTAIDFKSYGGGTPWAIRGYDWALTRAGRWMARNAWRYGFVLSYPKGARGQVCYGYEPWHYRYFGRTVARAIHGSGLTPRVWLWRHGNSPGPAPTPTPSPTPSPTPTQAATPTPVETATPAPTDEPTTSPTDPPVPTEAPTPTRTESPTDPPVPTEAPTPTPTATDAPGQTLTPAPTPTPGT